MNTLQVSTDLSRLLGGVEHSDDDRLVLVLRHRHTDAQEGIEGVALALAPGTRQGGAELRLEHGVHEAVVAAHVVGEGLCCHDVIRPPKGVL